MGGVAGILGTDAAATIFLLKSVYAFLAPLSFALALPLPLSDVSALDTRKIEGERLRPLLILIYLLFGRQKRTAGVRGQWPMGVTSAVERESVRGQTRSHALVHFAVFFIEVFLPLKSKPFTQITLRQFKTRNGEITD